MNGFKKLLVRFWESKDRCLNCGGEYQQIDKYFTAEGYKILIDGCKKCGFTRER